MDEQEERMGGTEGDIHTLYYWSRIALLVFIIAAFVWGALAAFYLWRGLYWYEWDMMAGSTRAVTDLTWSAVLWATLVLTALVARFLWNDVVAVFKARRFQVQREKLLVYSMLGFPLALGVAGLLLVLVNLKLSNPEFMPSHAEAYPVDRPWPEGAAPPPVEAVLPPEPAAPEMEGLPALAAAPPGAPPAPVAAIVEEVPTEAALAEAFVEEMAPEVLAQVPAAPVAAIVEEVPPEEGIPEAAPPPAAVMAIVEEVPEEELAEFEEVVADETISELPEETTAPKDIHEAHEELLTKLLGK